MVTALTAFLVLAGFTCSWLLGSGKHWGWLCLAALQAPQALWVVLVVNEGTKAAIFLIIEAAVFAAICVRNYFSTRYDIHVDDWEAEEAA